MSRTMRRERWLEIVRLCSKCMVLAAFAACLGGQSLAAASDKSKAIASHHAYRAHRVYRGAPNLPIPRRPEYGFLKRVPPNAIRMPGYIFVPGVGILGESCDLPTSACSNAYRDIQ